MRKATLASILRKARHGVRLNEHLEHPEGAVESVVSGSAGRESSPRTNARKPYSVLRRARRRPISPGATRWTPLRLGGCLRRLG